MKKLVSIESVMSTSGVRFGTSGARGLVSAMTDEVCYAYALAFLQAVAADAKTIVLGHDLRPSSPRIVAACAAAIEATGRQVIYAGALPTPALAFYAEQIGAPAIVVTGSHIPFDRNGIKFYRADGEISKVDELAIAQAQVEVPSIIVLTELPLPDVRVGQTYVQRYVDFFGTSALAGAKVAVYEHSSVARDILRVIFEGLGATVISLGRAEVFVPIDTEAVRAEDVAQAKLWAQQQQFDMLVSTDGDADRPLIGDETGVWLRGDVAGILCAQFLQADVVVTPVSSNTAVEKCGAFAQVIRTRIGSPYVIAGMESAVANGAVVGYEANGGFLLGSKIVRNGRSLAALPTRDAVLPMLALLCLARERACPVSKLAEMLPARFSASDRIQNFATERSAALLAQLLVSPYFLAETLAPNAGAISHIDQTDGLRATFENGDIVHLRPSGNAPELRCYAESNSADLAKSLCEACLAKLVRLD